MKCISCGNEIPNSSTSCPFCGRNVEPLSQAAVPTYEVQEQQDFNATPLVTKQDLSMMAVPATPENPVLPQDQGMQAQPVAPAVPVGNEAAPNMNATIPPVPGSEVQTEVPKTEINMAPPVVAATSGVMTGVQAPTNTPVAPQAEMISGVRESSSSIIAEDKKKAKSKKMTKVLIAVVLIVLLVAGGGFGYAYYSQTQTATTRINAIIDQVIKFDSNINQKMNISSGKYSFGGELSLLGQTYAANVYGTYAYDVDKKIMDYTANLKQLDFGDTKLIDKDPLSVEFYLADSNLYVLLQNFYDKYIYSEVEGVDELFENIGKNDVNYVSIINGVKQAIKASINVVSKKQTVKDISIGDTKKKANVITIKLTKANQEAMAKAFMNSIANNNAMLEEIAKFEEGMTAKDLQEEINKSIAEAKFDDLKDEEQTWEIYTAMFGSEFYGVRATQVIDGKEEKLEIYPVTDGYRFVGTSDKNEIYNITLTHKTQKSSSEVEDNFGIDAILSISDNVVKLKIEGSTVSDVNPKVERPNTKESIKLENLTEEDMKKIEEKLFGFGNLGLLFQEIMESTKQNVTQSTICSQAYDCNCPEGSSMCQCSYMNPEGEIESVSCPNYMENY